MAPFQWPLYMGLTTVVARANIFDTRSMQGHLNTSGFYHHDAEGAAAPASSPKGPPRRRLQHEWTLPHGCNLATGKRCRLENGTMHPAVAEYALNPHGSATLRRAPAPSVGRPSEAVEHAVLAERQAKRAAARPPQPRAAAPLPDEDITDDEAVAGLLDWDAHHRQVPSRGRVRRSPPPLAS